MASLREQLARKRAHSTSLTFPLGEEGERAKAALEAAQRTLELARIVNKGDGAQSVEQAEQRVREAQQELDEHSVTVTFRGLTEEERDTLMSAHPATDEQKAKEAEQDVPADQRTQINRATFLPAALALAALDSDLSEADWAAELASDRWTAGEKNALFTAVVSATNAEPAPGVGKGFATTR